MNVKLGRGSVSTIEVMQGLQPRDKVIVSDMSQWDNVSESDSVMSVNTASLGRLSSLRSSTRVMA